MKEAAISPRIRMNGNNSPLEKEVRGFKFSKGRIFFQKIGVNTFNVGKMDQCSCTHTG